MAVFFIQKEVALIYMTSTHSLHTEKTKSNLLRTDMYWYDY